MTTKRLSPAQAAMLAEIAAGTYRTTSKKIRTETVLVEMGLIVLVEASAANGFRPSVALASAPVESPAFVRPTGAALAAARLGAARR